MIQAKEDLVQLSHELEMKVEQKTRQLRQKDLQLMAMDRVVGIGALAADISHEINNPLGFMASSLNFLKKNVERIKDNDDIVTIICNKLNVVKRGIDRIADIIKNMRSFARLNIGL